MKGPNNAKLIVLHPSLHKVGGGGGSFLVSIHRLWLVAFVSFSALASLLFTLLSRHPAHRLPPYPAMPAASSSSSSSGSPPALSPLVFDALLHYAAASAAAANSSGGRMAEADLLAAVGVVWRRAPCNLLVFGLGAETPLWRALNAGGRTVFLDENEYYVAHLESLLPGLEAYDVAFAFYASARDFRRLVSAARGARASECRPVQDLLFSDCPLALNDLPNHLYDVAWDVILVDGPRGNDPAAPGRMAPSSPPPSWRAPGRRPLLPPTCSSTTTTARSSASAPRSSSARRTAPPPPPPQPSPTSSSAPPPQQASPSASTPPRPPPPPRQSVEFAQKNPLSCRTSSTL